MCCRIVSDFVCQKILPQRPDSDRAARSPHTVFDAAPRALETDRTLPASSGPSLSVDTRRPFNRPGRAEVSGEFRTSRRRQWRLRASQDCPKLGTSARLGLFVVSALVLVLDCVEQRVGTVGAAAPLGVALDGVECAVGPAGSLLLVVFEPPVGKKTAAGIGVDELL